MALIDVVFALLFVASSGLLFSKRFRDNTFLVVCAGIIALVSTYFLTENIVERTVTDRIGQAKPQTTTVADISRWRVTRFGLGPIQIGMSLSDAYAALGIPLDEVNADMGFPRPNNGSAESGAPSACFSVAPRKGRLGIEFLVERGRITRIDVSSPAILTERNIGLGSTVARLKDAYGDDLKVKMNVPNTPIAYVLGAGEGSNEIFFSPDNKNLITTFDVGSMPAAEYPEGCE